MVGVVSTPDVFERTLIADDRMIILGSDGLWEFIPSEEVVQIIQDCENPQVGVERWIDGRRPSRDWVPFPGNGGSTRKRLWTTPLSLWFFWER